MVTAAQPAVPATPAYTPSFTPSTGSPTASAVAGTTSVGQVDPSGLSDTLAQNQFNRLSSESGSTSPYFLGAVAGGTANTINNLSRQWSGTSATVAGYDAATSAKLTQEKQQADAAAAAKQANQMVSEMQSGAIAADAANQKRLIQLQQQAGQIAQGYSQLLGSLNSGAGRTSTNLGYSGTTYRGDLNAGYDTQSRQAAARAESLGYNLGELNYSKTYTYDPTLDNARNKALQIASSYLGTRYVLDGESHYSMDCSGLVQLVYQQLGFRVPTHSAADQGQTGGRSNGNGIPGVKVAWGSSLLQPGDLIAWKDGSHIAIYAGHGQIIEAANTNVGTVRRALWASPDAVVGIHLSI